MKFIGKLLLTLFLLLVLTLVLSYLLLQTTYVATWLSHWFNNHQNQYHFSFKKIDHSWSNPTQLRLMDVTLSPVNQSACLNVRQVVLRPGWQQITRPFHFRNLLLQDGTLDIDFNALPMMFPISADSLQLNNLSLNTRIGPWPLSAQQVNAEVLPWQLSSESDRDENQFTLSAGLLNINGITARQVLLEGTFHQNNWVLRNFGAEIAQGTITGDLTRLAQGDWLFNGLRLSNIRLQSPDTLSALWQFFTQLPPITFKRFDLVDARLEGIDWALNDLDVTLQNVKFHQGTWQADDGTLALNAADIITGKLHLVDPIVNLELSSDKVLIKQLTTRWEGGLLRTNGHWMRENQHLQLDEIAIAALEYTLPAHWKQLWKQPLPSWLSGITITKLSAHNNLLIDITPDFPFQLTALDGYGKNLVLIHDNQWALSSGELTLNASNATFNKNDLRRPAMTVTAHDQHISVKEVSAFANTGLLEGSATLNQHNHQFSLQLNGREVDTNTLHPWGWPLLPLQGKGNFILQLTGNLTAPFKSSLSGELQVTGSDKQQINQLMQQGEVINAKNPSYPDQP